jgi:subtilisin-like proprotein convertase family protein
MRSFFLSGILFFNAILLLNAQQTSYFQPIQESEIRLSPDLSKGVDAVSYRTYTLQHEALKSQLWTAPMEFTPAAREATCIIQIPMADGTFEPFSVWETAMMEPALAAEFPYIKTFAGKSLKNKARTARLSYTAWGFRAMVMQPDHGLTLIEPYAWGQEEYYIVYNYKDQRQNPIYTKERRWEPGDITAAFRANDQQPFVPAPVDDRDVLSEPVQMKVYRLVVSTTGEFSIDHGGTKPLVFSKVTEYTNMVSGFFERDIAMRVQLMSYSQNVIFLSPGSDPFTGLEVGDWMSQNPSVLNQYASSNSYDVGHVYARYIQGGAIGVAGGITCTDGKGRGCSAGNGNNDYGTFFVGVIGQELGHQMSGGHTWNRCDGGGGRAGLTAFEPGGGSTIMSYAGACGPDNIQGSADLYYHAGSIEEIRNFYTFNAGTGCGSFTTTDNKAPVVTLPYTNNFFIPVSTPFELNGSATDEDGDALVYNWEEVDAGPETPLGLPSGNAATFRTWPSVDVTNRYFPRLSLILANQSSNAEQLPTYTRDLTFRLSARDNRPNGGGVGWADVAFKSWEAAGPFLVTDPNTSSVIWRVGEYVNVTWDVANTDQTPVNCKNVNIRLSTDGGLTYPITLAQNVVNDGSQFVLVPNQLSNTCRIRIDAADNVFFDISNANFKIQNPVQPSFTFGLSTDVNTLCLPATFTTDILSTAVLGFSSDVEVGLLGNLPSGATYAFTTTQMQPGQTNNLNIDLSNVNVNGTFNMEVWARLAATGDTLHRPITLHLFRNDFSGQSLNLPLDGSSELGLTQTLYWSPGLDAVSYDVQFAKSPAFNVILWAKVATEADSFKIPQLLEKNTAYYWRIRPRNVCGIHDWSEPFFFSTYAEQCNTFQANDLPKVISSGAVTTIESQINVLASGTISDLNIDEMSGFHNWFSDLEVRLISPAGTNLLLFKNKCGNTSASFNFGADDDAFGFPCPPPNNGTALKPQNPLSIFNGENIQGPWILRVKDNVTGSGGSLNTFKLEFCASVDVQPPFLVKNEILYLPGGTNAAVSNAYLEVSDPDNSAAQLTFTLMTKPLYGQLERTGSGILEPGSSFTQQDINNGLIRYYDFGSQQPEDYFKFSVSDGTGGFLASPIFRIRPESVGTESPVASPIELTVFPNPARDLAVVRFNAPLSSDIQLKIIDLSGRTLQTLVFSPGQTSLQIPLAQVSAGLYLIQVLSDGRRGISKLVVQR